MVGSSANWRRRVGLATGTGKVHFLRPKRPMAYEGLIQAKLRIDGTCQSRPGTASMLLRNPYRATLPARGDGSLSGK